MRVKWNIIILLGIFLLVFGIRLFIINGETGFSDDKSYLTLRQVENIAATGKPIINDDLSYGGRTLFFSPVFYYILTFVYLIFKTSLSLKIFLNLVASLVVIITYMISFELTKSRKTSLLSAALSGFIPIFFNMTTNSLSPYSLILPLTFVCIYFLILLNKNIEYYTYFLFFSFFSILISPVSIILILGTIFFLILARLEKIEISKANFEIVIVTLFFYLWFYFLIFKKALLFHGPKVIWQNIPKEFLSTYFSEITITETVSLIGILPFVLGTYLAYIYITKEKSLQVYIIIGSASSLFFLLWFKLIPLKIGLMFLGGFLILLVSQYLKNLFDYIEKTKFVKYEPLVILGFIILIIISSIIPSMYYAKSEIKHIPSNTKLDSFVWINQNIDSKSVVLSPENEGHLLAYYGKTKTVIDNNFLMANKLEQRINDIKRIYTTRFSDEALEFSKKYEINYIIVDKEVRDIYKINDLFYSSDNCFSLVYDKNDVKIYKVECK